MKKKILAILLCVVIITGYTGASYKQAQAIGFEGIIAAVAGSTVGTGVAIGLAVCGVAYTGYQIYSHKEQLAEAGKTIANAYVGYVSKKVQGEVTKVKLATQFVGALGEKVIETGSEAWDYWKEFVHDMVTESLSLSDFDGKIFNGKLSDFPSTVKLSDVYYDCNYTYKNSYHKYTAVQSFADATAVVFSPEPINVKDVHYLSVVFKDMVIPFVMYRSSKLAPIGITKSFGNQIGDRVYTTYNNLTHNDVKYSMGEGYYWRSNDTESFISGSTDVFKIDSTWQGFKDNIDNFVAGKGMEYHALLEGLAPKVYDIDNWGSQAWQKESTSAIDDYPTSKDGITGIDNVQDVPDSVVDAIDAGKAWDVIPRTNVDNWTASKSIPDSVSVNDNIASKALPGCKTIEEALEYAKAHDIPLSKVLEAMGVKVGDYAKDIDYADTIGATMAQEGVKADEKVGIDKTVVKPFIPSSNSKGEASEYTLEGLDELFPFCVPFDVFRLISFLKAEPKAPKLKWNVPTINGTKIKNNEIEIDFSKYDEAAEICRTLEFIAFCLGFVLIVRKLIRG